ncbi:MAG: PspA/IM30 family protein [Georgenia sp.]
MSIRRRLFDVARARRAARQPAPDPVQAFEAAYQEQVTQLEQAHRAVADVAAQRRRVEILADQAAAEEADQNGRASAAVALGRDDDAREFLRRARTAGQRRALLGAQRQQLDEQVRHLERTLGRLARRVEDERLRFQALRADHDAARAAIGIHEAERAAAAQRPGIAGAAREAERQTRELRARAEAYDELSWTDSTSQRAREAFAELESEAQTEAALDRLKERHRIEGSGRPQELGPA